MAQQTFIMDSGDGGPQYIKQWIGFDWLKITPAFSLR